MTSKLVVNTIEADTGISSVSFASSISLSSTSKFFFGAAGIDIGADTNINRPEAGVLGFNINGTEKVRITSDAKVGIGEDPTISQFQVKTAQLGGTAGNTQEVVRLHSPDVSNTTSYRFTNYRTSNGTSHVTSELRFRRHVDSTDMGYFGLGDQYVSIGYGTAEKLRIDSSGRVMIGTTTEGTGSGDDLTISNTGNMGLTLRSTSSNYCNIYFSDATSGTAEYEGYMSYNHATNSLEFATGHTERLRINSSGQLIQRYSTDPYNNRAATFQSPSGVTSTYIAVVNTETNGASGILFGDHAGQNAGNYDGYIQYSHQYQHMAFMVASGGERVRIDANGSVGINETNPGSYDPNAESLVIGEISGGDGNAGMTIVSGATDKQGSIYFADGTGSASYRGRIEYKHSNDSLCLGTAGSGDKLVIDSSGIISMPNQPMVRTRGGWSNVDWNGFKQISWSGEDEDIGGNFSSGVFTVPSGGAGRYVMTAQFIGPSSAGQFVLWSFFKNTTSLNPWVQIYSGSTNTETGAGTVAVTCAAGDTLRIAWHGNYSSPYNGGYNSFSIYKVH